MFTLRTKKTIPANTREVPITMSVMRRSMFTVRTLTSTELPTYKKTPRATLYMNETLIASLTSWVRSGRPQMRDRSRAILYSANSTYMWAGTGASGERERQNWQEHDLVSGRGGGTQS
jgi:hypothetical protein